MPTPGPIWWCAGRGADRLRSGCRRGRRHFVPLPHAVDDHQTRNALTLVDGGAAEFLPQSELTTASLAARLSWLAGRRKPY